MCFDGGQGANWRVLCNPSPSIRGSRRAQVHWGPTPFEQSRENRRASSPPALPAHAFLDLRYETRRITSCCTRCQRRDCRGKTSDRGSPEVGSNSKTNDVLDAGGIDKWVSSDEERSVSLDLSTSAAVDCASISDDCCRVFDGRSRSLSKRTEAHDVGCDTVPVLLDL